MWIFYALATIPVLIGAILWAKDKRVVWWEWLIASAVGYITAGLFQIAAFAGMTSDIETWSGRIDSAVHYPTYVEQYEQVHFRTVDDGDGKSHTETYYTTEYRTHPEHWTAYTTIPDSHEIDRGFFEEVTKNFGDDIATEDGHYSGFFSGDPHQYVVRCKTDYIYPVTTTRTWTNRIKAAPTLFSFIKVDPKLVYSWPENRDWRQSNRLIGTGLGVTSLEFDRMNARLGSTKHVNVILIGAGAKDSSWAELQRAAWVGGKKNDLVLVVGNNWAKVFGWSESEICKRNLETILLEHPIDDKILPMLEAEIRANYKIKDWSKFDYITIEAPAWSYWVFGIVLAVTQFALWIWAYNNEQDKRDVYSRHAYQRSGYWS